MSTLKQNICGIQFQSPITVGAGPLTERFDLIKKAAECGAGSVSIKQTPFSQPRPGVRKMYAERSGFLFNPSDRRLDYNYTEDLVKKLKDSVDIPVFVNILGEAADVDTWIFLAEKMQNAGADGVELNFACPNSPGKIGQNGSGFQYGASMSKNPELAATVISGLIEAVKIPVWVKFSGDGTDTATLCKKAEEAKASGIVAFCSPRGAFPIDIYNAGKPKMAAMDKCSFGGVNGAAIRPASLMTVAQAAQAVKSVPIMGGGGISKPEHVIEYIMYGASLVFIFTDIMLNGFDVITKYNEWILKFMEENGYETIKDMRGLALNNIIQGNELPYEMGPKAKIDLEQCIGCGSCEKIGFCRAISIENKKAVVNQEVCESCGLCASICPKKAIFF